VHAYVCGVRSIAADEKVVVCNSKLARTCEVGLLAQRAEVAAIRLPDQQGFLRSVHDLVQRRVIALDYELRKSPDRYLSGCAEQIEP
jgi:hypothetical protein